MLAFTVVIVLFASIATIVVVIKNKKHEHKKIA